MVSISRRCWERERYECVCFVRNHFSLWRPLLRAREEELNSNITDLFQHQKIKLTTKYKISQLISNIYIFHFVIPKFDLWSRLAEENTKKLIFNSLQWSRLEVSLRENSLHTHSLLWSRRKTGTVQGRHRSSVEIELLFSRYFNAKIELCFFFDFDSRSCSLTLSRPEIDSQHHNRTSPRRQWNPPYSSLLSCLHYNRRWSKQ